MTLNITHKHTHTQQFAFFLFILQRPINCQNFGKETMFKERKKIDFSGAINISSREILSFNGLQFPHPIYPIYPIKI